MATIRSLVPQVQELLRQKDVNRVVYMHCDHWEPWYNVRSGVPIYCQENHDSIIDFANTVSRIDFARKLSLFYKPAFGFQVGEGIKRDDLRAYFCADPEDQVNFLERGPNEKALAASALRGLLSLTKCEIQVHLHHENFTYNTALDSQERIDYLGSSNGRQFEEKRIATAIQLCLRQIEEDTGQKLDKWHFVHGHWGLQASDPSVCHLTREIEILKDNGCIADWTVPSGRPVVNPRIEIPYFCDPIDQAKGYDSLEANPEIAYGNCDAPQRNKFLIWSSKIKHRGSSIDYYAPWVRERLENPLMCVKEIIETSYAINGTLYVKTHAHSMHPSYNDVTRVPIFPHAYPGIQQMLGLLFDSAIANNAQLDFLTVQEVYDEFTSTDFQHEDSLVLSPLGDRTDTSGIIAPAKNWEPGFQGRYVSKRGSADDTIVSSSFPEVAKIELNQSNLNNTSEGAKPYETHNALKPKESSPILDKQWSLSQLVNESAVRILNARIAQFGEVGSGAGNYYAEKVRKNEVLAKSEINLAGVICETIGRDQNIFEIGSGFGTLAMLLAASGFNVTGLETDSKRFAAANDIYADLMPNLPNDAAIGELSFKKGNFPNIELTPEICQSLVIVSNLTTSLSSEEADLFAQTLTKFRRVVIDVQRFLISRFAKDEIDMLISRLVGFGLSNPTLICDCKDQGLFYAFDGVTRAESLEAK